MNRAKTTMFSKIRLQFTLLYMLIAVAFVVIIGSFTYGLLTIYLQSITDLALRHKIAHEYEVMNLPMPPELTTADQQWADIRKRIFPSLFGQTSTSTNNDNPKIAGGPVTGQAESVDKLSLEEAYDGELSAIFLIPLDAQGHSLKTALSENRFAQSRGLPDQQAVQVALHNGFDMRTIQSDDGTRLRLLTYHLPPNSGATFLQLGRVLSDQDRLMRQLLIGLIAAGALVGLISSVSSWWLAGRSLRPAQAAFERQHLFVANASHELRTPLTLIRASAEVAQSSLRLDDEQRALLKDVIEEADHMTRLVNDLLLLSRLDAGQLVLEKRAVALAELLTDVKRQITPLANERDLSISLKKADGVAWGDRDRLRQVLLILLDNALRHTPQGGGISLESKEHGHGIWITVSDTGTGILPEDLPHVFDYFYRADRARTGGENAGLGLSIAKSLIEAHKGEIRIESQLGVGTSVRLALPSVKPSTLGHQ